MVNAVIFDMDGVIIDSEMDYIRFDLEFAKTKNPNVKAEQLFAMVGLSREDAWTCMAKAVDNGQTWEELYHDFKTSMDAFVRMDFRRIYRQEVTGVLEKLRRYGIKIALASSTQMDIIQRVLDENGIREYFQVVVSGRQFERSKPDPEIYHYTANALGVPEAECFVIEDSTYGIAAASRAGMKVAALIDERFGFDQSLADFHIKQIGEVLSLIEREAHIV